MREIKDRGGGGGVLLRGEWDRVFRGFATAQCQHIPLGYFLSDWHNWGAISCDTSYSGVYYKFSGKAWKFKRSLAQFFLFHLHRNTVFSLSEGKEKSNQGELQSISQHPTPAVN